MSVFWRVSLWPPESNVNVVYNKSALTIAADERRYFFEPRNKSGGCGGEYRLTKADDFDAGIARDLNELDCARRRIEDLERALKPDIRWMS